MSSEETPGPHPVPGTRLAVLRGKGPAITPGVEGPEASLARLAGLGGWEELLGGRANDYLPGLQMKGFASVIGSLAPDTWLSVLGQTGWVAEAPQPPQ